MDNRSTLLRCALDLFAARGYDAVAVQDIVEAAGVTKPTLYHYFGSKHGLLQVLLAQHLDPFIEALRQAAGYHHDLPFHLQNVVKTFFAFARQNRSFYRLQLALWFAPHESEGFKTVELWNHQQYGLIELMFEKAEKDHGNMKGRHAIYSATFTGMINTCIGLWLNGYCELDDDLVYRVVHQFEHGIYS
jgi:AcrR family transcriptional regulator